jgi:hypothetical protein
LPHPGHKILAGGHVTCRHTLLPSHCTPDTHWGILLQRAPALPASTRDLEISAGPEYVMKLRYVHSARFCRTRHITNTSISVQLYKV